MRMGWIRHDSASKRKLLTEKVFDRLSTSIVYSILLIFVITTKILSISVMK